ncbi:probable ATP-dependent RNA helicase DDX10 [Brienomyrus brachyistius]|uniref:probable ATP-dependent RNA helicase DDX10 n=1 Tax=Brienomyrus brachyistius TaxID=42636 RepID=UPI0020B42303|nr:probable ATP-dependent RNA helicase DDX10 [Brienomyrus brachyistius]XP_048838931.1 probable ATP-dependent RNA helicase DDX10 [Brienomyrus brachyistius]
MTGETKATKTINPRNDPVKNFEKWKKKYDKTKKRVKRQKKQIKKPEWQIEKEKIKKLVDKYSEINTKDVVKFSDFPLSKETLRGLLEAQYRQPTEIQKQTIGFALTGKDVLGAAKTGSGKTLAFLIPVLECLFRQQWSADDGLGALIISPTRELAYQTFEVLRKVGKNHEFSAGLIIGGKDLKQESERIHRTNIIICTPGRLLQHMDETCTFHASSLQVLVLDEADRILDMGFADTLNAIVQNLPKTRQTLLFSATQTKSVKDLARLSLKDPEYVWVHEKAKFSTPATLEQSYLVCELHHKVNLLFSFLKSHLKKKIIVFFACCKEVQYLFRVFCRLRPGIPVLALHGKQQQMKRMEVYNDFIGKKAAVMFATDIAARGLDFPAVNWVLQFDCPEDANTYIHRAGRTARYKEGGEALLVLLPTEEKGMIKQLQEKKVPINKIQVNPAKMTSVQQKLQAFLAQEKEQKERAQRCFVSYLRSVYLMKNKDVFDVFQLPLQEYAGSLGLAVAPRVRFLSKARQQRGGAEATPAAGPGNHPEEEDEELESFRAQVRGERLPPSVPGTDGEALDALRSVPKAEEEEDPCDSQDEEQSDSEQDSKNHVFGQVIDEEDDEKDLDLFTVKRKDVFKSEDEDFAEEEKEEKAPKKNPGKESKFKEVKKVLKRKLKVNTRITFTEDGEMVQQWPPLQRTAAPAGSDGEEPSGINVEKARERLRIEDQEFDKQEYSRKVKEKHRAKRLKERAARQEASKKQKEQSKGSSGESDEEEVVAFLGGDDDSSGEEFDPSTLPDPDKYADPERNDDSSVSSSDGVRKRSRPADSSSESDEEEAPAPRKRTKRRDRGELETLDTGLSLVEDEELVLHLLGQRN